MIGADSHRYLLVRHYARNCYVRCLNEATSAEKRQLRNACCEEAIEFCARRTLLENVQDALGDSCDGANEFAPGDVQQDAGRIEHIVSFNDAPRQFMGPPMGRCQLADAERAMPRR